jgi:hypothetical protein
VSVEIEKNEARKTFAFYRLETSLCVRGDEKLIQLLFIDSAIPSNDLMFFI